ncbi:MAG TPA: thioredoxin family protein [Epsilonproteobacteria bacterium]|nr:thioredoxin family protein [Campylobacterota bacterium]
MKIELLGTRCTKCKALEKVVQEAISKSGKFVEYQKIDSIPDIIAYGVVSTPGLVINGKVLSTGKLLTLDEVLTLMENA